MSYKSSAISPLLFLPTKNVSDLDRLLDEIRFDIQKLLNTRRPYLENEGISENGVLGYGISDLSQFRSESESDQVKIAEEVAALLTTYEPRLHAIKITIENNQTDKKNYHIALHIEALLQLSNVRDPIGFQSILELAKPAFKIEGMHYE